MTASRTTPTLCVLVIMTGPSRNPESSTQCVPVISPLPFRLKIPAKTGSSEFLPRGRIAVTPVLTGPIPTFSLPSPEISVVWPTSTPLTSVIALRVPGVPSNGTPKSRARSFDCPDAIQTKNADKQVTTLKVRILALRRHSAVYSRSYDQTRRSAGNGKLETSADRRLSRVKHDMLRQRQARTRAFADGREPDGAGVALSGEVSLHSGGVAALH